MMATQDQMDALQVDVIVDDDVAMPVEIVRLVQAAIAAGQHLGCHQGEIGIRVAGDQEIQRINRTHLQHDYPTDVISFGYLHQTPRVEGELVVSAETAVRTAAELNWVAANELILYVVHGTLHLCGMDDQQPAARSQMRQAELSIMQQLGIAVVDRHAVDPDGPSRPLSGQPDASQPFRDDDKPAAHSPVQEEHE